MARKKKCSPRGAPEWVMTYGDMMSLLLAFFILLVALSEIDRDKFRVKAKAIKSHFAGTYGGGILPSEEDPNLRHIQTLENLQFRLKKFENESKSEEEGIDGTDDQVTEVRKTMTHIRGGRIIFEPGSARLSPRAKGQIDEVATRMRGNRLKIELHGHASSIDLAAGSNYSDLYALTTARAKAVMQYMTSPRVGIRKERIRIVSNADHEPVISRIYERPAQAPNRRVEIIETDELVEDLTRPQVLN